MQRFQKLQVSIALVAVLAAMLPAGFATDLCGDRLSFDLTVTNAAVERVAWWHENGRVVSSVNAPEYLRIIQ